MDNTDKPINTNGTIIHPQINNHIPSYNQFRIIHFDILICLNWTPGSVHQYINVLRSNHVIYIIRKKNENLIVDMKCSKRHNKLKTQEAKIVYGVGYHLFFVKDIQLILQQCRG